MEGYFKANSGLRQGDSLSPYLFVIAIEVMTACIKKTTTNSNFLYHWHTKEASITYLIFADDVFLFCNGEIGSAKALMEGLKIFSRASGLIPNVNKSQCFFGNVQEGSRNSILALSGFQEGNLPIKYLGLPLLSTKLTVRDCCSLFLKLRARIDSWLCRFSSFAGRH